MTHRVLIGTAGWSIPAASAANFIDGASHLERYASRFDAVEINSSFHRPHRRTTYERWAATVPEDFRFAVKLPKLITHVQRLAGDGAALERFAGEVGGLRSKLAVLLVQLPPSLAFDEAAAVPFFTALRATFDATPVCEPRHASWFMPQVDALLADLRVARVAADPAPVPDAAYPGGWSGLRYFRLHGSPVIYRSSYDEPRLSGYAGALRAPCGEAWCILDNTASMAATADALALRHLVDEASDLARPTGTSRRADRSEATPRREYL